jgi:hypothetical protein
MLIMIEHFSKWLEVMWLLDFSNEGAIYAFFDRVFSNFGVLIEVFIDQGMEFHWEIQELCEKVHLLIIRLLHETILK